MNSVAIAMLLTVQTCLQGQTIRLKTDMTGTFTVNTNSRSRALVDSNTGRPLAIYVTTASSGYRIQPADNNTDDWARIDFEFRISDGHDAYNSKADADRTGPPWVKKIFTVKGVEALGVGQYELRVRKSNLSKWEDILVTVADIVVKEVKQ